MTKRTKDALFLALLADAVACTFKVPDLAPAQVASLDELRAKMDSAGLLEDLVDD